MVKIHFWKDPEKKSIHMSVKGHAGTAPKGADLVCASATMLVYTVAQAMTFMHEQGYLEAKPHIKIREGKAVVSAIPKDEYSAEVLHTFWVAQCGGHVLAKNYPEAVSLNHLTV
jgi:uncharacterized protein YsxB (DUF464 family)